MEMQLIKKIRQQTCHCFISISTSPMTTCQAVAHMGLSYIIFLDSKTDIADHLASRLQLERRLEPFSLHGRKRSDHELKKLQPSIARIRNVPALISSHVRVVSIGKKGLKIRVLKLTDP
jgi:hypothetical protein